MEGYIYVVAFSDDTIKVGRSGDAGRRISQHEQTAKAHGQSVTHSWYSIPHVEYQENEKKLISWCSERASDARSRERFSGLRYPQVVRYALSLTATRLTEEEKGRAETRGQAFVEMIQEAVAEIPLEGHDRPINFEAAMYSVVVDAYEKQAEGIFSPGQAYDAITAAYVIMDVLKKLYPIGICPKGDLVQMIDHIGKVRASV